MKVTRETISNIPDNDRELIISLLNDIRDINNSIKDYSENIYIDWQDYHDEYSPERTDPCPDYYGMYTIMRNNECLSEKLTLNDLDSQLCLLYNYVVE